MKNLLEEARKLLMDVIKEVKKLTIPSLREVLGILFWVCLLGLFLTLFLFAISELIVPIIRYLF